MFKYNIENKQEIFKIEIKLRFCDQNWITTGSLILKWKIKKSFLPVINIFSSYAPSQPRYFRKQLHIRCFILYASHCISFPSKQQSADTYTLLSL